MNNVQKNAATCYPDHPNSFQSFAQPAGMVHAGGDLLACEIGKLSDNVLGNTPGSKHSETNFENNMVASRQN
ncbi:MAG: hypothetical protein WBL63_12615 [Candidatus Acidiferrum sp.]